MNYLNRPNEYPKWYISIRTFWDKNKESIIRALVYVSLVASLIKAITSLVCLCFFNDTETLKGFVSQVSCIALVLYIVYWFKPKEFEMYVNKLVLQLFLNRALRGFILLFFDATYSMFYLNYVGLKGTGTEKKSNGDWLYANLESSTVLFFFPYFFIINNLYTLACINSFFILLGRLCIRVLDFGVTPSQLNMEYIRRLIEEESFVKDELFNNEKFKSLPPKLRYVYKRVYWFTKEESSTYLPMFIFLVSFFFRYSESDLVKMFMNLDRYVSYVAKFKFKPLRLAVSRQASTSAIQMFRDIPKVHLYFSGAIVSKAADKGQKIAKNALEEAKAHPIRTVVVPTITVVATSINTYRVVKSNTKTLEVMDKVGDKMDKIDDKMERFMTNSKQEFNAKDIVDNKNLEKVESKYLSQEQIKGISNEIKGNNSTRQNSLDETVNMFSSNLRKEESNSVETVNKDEIKLNSVFEDLEFDSGFFGFICLILRFFKQFKD